MEGIWDSRNFSGFLCVAGARNLHPVPVAVDLSDILSSLISLLFCSWDECSVWHWGELKGCAVVTPCLNAGVPDSGLSRGHPMTSRWPEGPC